MRNQLRSTFSALLIPLSLILWVSSAVAESTPDAFNQFKQQQSAAFSRFQSAQDRAFIGFLEREWAAYEVFAGLTRDQRPKPPQPIIISHQQGQAGEPGSVADAYQVSVRNPAPPDNRGFYGQGVPNMTLPLAAAHWPILKTPSNKALAKAWDVFSQADHTPLLTEIRQLQSRWKLDDWGLYKLVRYTLKRHAISDNQRTAFAWYLLNQLGFDTRISARKTELLLLLPTAQQLYEVPFIKLDKQTYYLLDEASEASVAATLQTYDQPYDTHQSIFDVDLALLPEWPPQPIDVVFRPTTNTHLPTLSLSYDATLTQFLQDYPKVELAAYFRAIPAVTTQQQLRTQLKPLITSLDQRAAVEKLLVLTQQLFKYQTDQQQFGEERYLGTDESLRYATNDCEDRAVFLSWLLRDLLNVDTVALDYPGHVALAARIKPLPSDAIITHVGRKYVVLDPTYIGAGIGQPMPAFRNVTPDVIHF